MATPGYGLSAALTVAAAALPETINDKVITGFCAVCTVAGNATITLTGGTQMTISLAVGTVILNLGVIRVNSSAATATYYALAE